MDNAEDIKPKKANILNNNINPTTVKTFSHKPEDNNNFNKDLFKHELHECLRVTHNATGNNSYTEDPVILNDNSYVKEFELYLKRYREIYDNDQVCINVASSMPNEQTVEEYNDDFKCVDFEQLLDLSNSYLNSEYDLPELKQNNRETNDFNDDNASGVDIVKAFNLEKELGNGKKDKHNYTYDIVDGFNNDMKKTDVIEENSFILISSQSSEVSIDTIVANTFTSRMDIVKSFYPETGLNCDNSANNDYNNTVQDFNDDIKNLDFVNEDNVIIISSESELSIDEILLDPSENYSQINNMQIDNFDEFVPETDSEDYNSSDFEFIDEEEACLSGIIDKTGSNMKTGLNSDKFNIVQDTVNYEAGPSSVRSRLDSNTVSRLNSRNNDLEVEQHNHIIPEGEQLYELFAEPWTMFDFQAENKAFFSNKAMNLEADDIGFNVEILHRRHEEHEVDGAIKEEAIENARKIVTMYPIENTKRTRRRNLL